MESKWQGLGLQAEIAARLEELNLQEPTAVQSEAIPALLAGQDVYARSQTGSGKTLAYLLPILAKIDPAKPDIQGLVLAPTQELAMQIVRVAEQFAESTGCRVQQLIGGAAVKRQLEKLKQKPHLVVGTPGRLYELLKMRKLRLHGVSAVVIDEADQMFELGSTKELEAVLAAVPASRQLAFFSATLPPRAEELAHKLMRQPVPIDVAREQKVAASIRHHAVEAEPRDKFETLKRLLHALKPASALVFVEDTDQIANWESKLNFEGFAAGSLYGDADKLRRSQTLDRFRDGKIRVLLATDVAARGIDLAALQLVVNLGVPYEADRYVHRAGRTGRMGRDGMVVTIVSPREWYLVDKLRRRLGIEIAQRELHGGKLIEPSERRPASSARRGPGAVTASQGAGGGTGRAHPDGSRPAERPAAPRGERRLEARAAGQPNGGTAPHRTQPADRPAKSAAAKPKPRPESAAKPGKAAKRERERARKDKGAPKWLKAKREASKPE